MVTVGDLIFGGSGTLGHLYQYDPATGASTDLLQAVPGQTKITALVLGSDGYVYGSTFAWYLDPCLFRFHPSDPWTRTNLGAPDAATNEITDLTVGHDGLVYGASGNALFSFDPVAGTRREMPIIRGFLT